MEIDNGSLHSIIGTSKFVKLWPVNPPELLPVSDQLLRTWSSEKLDVKGYVNVQVSYNSAYAKLPLLVVKGNGKSLIGRSWFDSLGIKVIIENSPSVNLITEKSIDKLIRQYSKIFSDKLGTFKGPPISIKVEENKSPVFFRARTVPFALRDRVSKELENMINKGILESVTYSDWATPIVPVVKKDGSIRICGDYRCTINQAVKQTTYPLPTLKEVLATVSGGTVFSKLDLSEAYLQLPVDEPTSRLLTLNTHKGLFRVKRLPFGVSVAVAIFQKRMEEVLCGIEGVLPYLDDIFIKGRDIESHNLKLQQVLERLDREGIRLRKEKCKFAVPEINLLGFRVNANGIQPTADKVAAIHQAPTPSNVTELQAFLGLLNFYGCFLKNRSDVLQPLHQLLQKDVRWCWTVEHDKAYKAAKELLQKDDLLVHYDEKLPIILTCDASSYGLGAVLSHKLPNGDEAPIAYYSRTMMKPEKNYSQTDKEALAIVAAVKKFHQYLFGRKFKIITDHKPLLGLFNPTKPIPQMVSPRVLRWSLCLLAYDYQLEYRQGKQIANADALSRLPMPTSEFEVPTPSDVLLLEFDPDPQIDSKLIASSTMKDPLLSRVSLWVLNGWPSKAPDDRFQPYFRRRNELSVHQGCVLWGSRVIIPEILKEEVLRLLHGSHPGIVRMKGLARSYVWWPNMDSQIESTVNACQRCQEFQRAPPKAPIHSWEWTEKPWSRLHIDFAGPFHGQTFFLVVDSHSKWLEVMHIHSMSATSIISKLRSLFATHGLPDTVCSDNGSTFVSEEFKAFLRKNQIRQILVAPYHPSSNGQAERMVATTKESLKRIVHGSWQTRLARFLFSQHTLPCTATNKSPSELLMNRRLTSILDRLHPDLNKVMHNKRADSDQLKNKIREFHPSDPVYIRNYSTGPPWSPAVVLESTGPLSYRIQSPDGHVTRRHVDQIRRRIEPLSRIPMQSPDPPSSPVTDANHEPAVVEESPVPEDPVIPAVTSSPELPPTPRRSQRTTSRPKFLKDYVLSTTGGVLCPDSKDYR